MLLPFQSFCLRNTINYEFNLGILYDVNPEYPIEYSKFKEVMIELVDRQPYLKKVYDRNKNRVIKKNTNEILKVNYEHLEECKEDLPNLFHRVITNYSKEIFHTQDYHLLIDLYDTNDGQKIVIVVDHFIMDGISLSFILKKMESILFFNDTLPSQSIFKTFETVLNEQRETPIDQLKYWQNSPSITDNTSFHTNAHQHTIIHTFNKERTKELIATLKKQRLQFNELAISSFIMAFKENCEEVVDKVDVMIDMRTYLKQKSFINIMGPLVFSSPLLFHNTYSTIHDTYHDVQRQFHTVAGKELAYTLLAEENKIPTVKSKFIYSNIGNIDKISSFYKSIHISSWYLTYFHGDTFDPNMPCYYEVFIRPYILHGKWYITVSFNTLQYPTEVMTTVLERMVFYIQKLVEDNS